MDEPQRMPNVSVFQPGKPARRILGKMNDVLAHDFDEHQLGKLGQQTFTSGVSPPGFFGGDAKHVRQPALCRRRHLAEEHARQRLEKRIERSRIAAEIAANQVAVIGAVIVEASHDRQRSIFRPSVFLEIRKTTHVWRRTQDIGVTHRVDDDITRIEALAGV